MQSHSFKEQFEISRKTLDGLDEAGKKIDRMAAAHDDIVNAMRRAGYTSELQAELDVMNAAFQNAVEKLKVQLFEDNMKFVHRQATTLKGLMDTKG
jgi:hypothetical protein